MSIKPHNDREPEAEVDHMFVDRWSPRSFLPEPLPENQIASLFEAARWAPSSSNEQPWIYLYAITPGDRKRFLSILFPDNSIWAAHAPMLVFVIARRNFIKSGRENRNALFDTGSSWMSLALQARKIGLYAHAMAGFDRKKAYEVLGIPEDDFSVAAAIAIGRKDDPAKLPPHLRVREKPSCRKHLSEVCYEGKFHQ